MPNTAARLNQPRRSPRHRPLLAACVAGVALLAAFPPTLPAWAGDGEAQPMRYADYIAMLDRDGLEHTLIDLDFRGGTFEEYVRALREAAKPVPVNVLNVEEGEGYTLGPVQVRHVTLEQAFAIVPRIVRSGPEHHQLRVIRDVDRDARRTGASVYRIESRQVALAPGDEVAIGPLQTELMNITSFIKPMYGYGRESVLTPEEVMEVLTLAMQAVASEPKPSLQLHRRTGTLLLKGTPAQIDAAKAARETLSQEVNMRHNIFGGLDIGALHERRELIRDLETHRQESLAEAKRAEDEIDHWRHSDPRPNNVLIAELRRDATMYTRQAEALAEEIEDQRREIAELEARLALARGSSPVDIEAPGVPEPTLRAIARVILAADPTAAVEVISLAGRRGLRVHEIHEPAVRELIAKIIESLAGAQKDVRDGTTRHASLEGQIQDARAELELQRIALSRAEHQLEWIRQARRSHATSDHEVRSGEYELQQATVLHQRAIARYEAAQAELRARGGSAGERELVTIDGIAASDRPTVEALIAIIQDADSAAEIRLTPQSSSFLQIELPKRYAARVRTLIDRAVTPQ
ncbi:MAG: hypothetical protein EA378_03645 [Phycisphaerales bacterium]|nr:MAG: hypothetical protein EA378_03645 [Phycisphaerales bacterium]